MNAVKKIYETRLVREELNKFFLNQFTLTIAICWLQALNKNLRNDNSKVHV